MWKTGEMTKGKGDHTPVQLISNARVIVRCEAPEKPSRPALAMEDQSQVNYTNKPRPPRRSSVSH